MFHLYSRMQVLETLLTDIWGKSVVGYRPKFWPGKTNGGGWKDGTDWNEPCLKQGEKYAVKSLIMIWKLLIWIYLSFA